jgi:cytochrome c
MKRQRPTPGSRGARGSIGFAALLVLLASGGCSDPDRQILARLGDSEAQRFRRGRALAVPCWTCHDLAGTVKKVGPSLLGLYGRRSGMAPDYVASMALVSAVIEWDDRTLAAFLRDPAGFVPGNRMVSPGIRDPVRLSDLLFYLRHVTRPGARGSDSS